MLSEWAPRTTGLLGLVSGATPPFGGTSWATRSAPPRRPTRSRALASDGRGPSSAHTAPDMPNVGSERHQLDSSIRSRSTVGSLHASTEACSVPKSAVDERQTTWHVEIADMRESVVVAIRCADAPRSDQAHASAGACRTRRRPSLATKHIWSTGCGASIEGGGSRCSAPCSPKRCTAPASSPTAMVP